MTYNKKKRNPGPTSPFDPDEFCIRIRRLARSLWRDLPWRQTHDQYRVWLSEVMLQQTQVSRVEARWEAWLHEFPTVGALAAADEATVLAAWQGMGYNRRALLLHRCARMIAERGGSFPRSHEELVKLPGVGPSTAAGIRAFAFDAADMYLETNVRTVFIHELFRGLLQVPDASIVPLVRATCPATGHDVRGWYYALLDYGAWLKREYPNPSRRSKGYKRQSRFTGSRRQKRASLLRILLNAHTDGVALETADLLGLLDQDEVIAGRSPVDPELAQELLDELSAEGFCVLTQNGWVIGSNMKR